MSTIETLRRRLTQPVGAAKGTAIANPGQTNGDATSGGRPANDGDGRRRTIGRQRPQIGLDIGSSAVRAAEVASVRGRPTVVRYGQVGLPKGAVVDGEITDIDAVGRAIRELWSRVGFGSTQVVLGVSSQRVMVRQADVPAMSESDFRQAIQFEAGDLIPITVDEAIMDFAIIDPDLGSTGGTSGQMRILLAAAHRQSIETHIAALKAGGVAASAIGVGGLALIRSQNLLIRSSSPQAVVDIGADLTTVTVAKDGELRYMRVLSSGGSSYTAALAEELNVPFAEAEALKRAGETPAQFATSDDPLVDQIAATLEYFASQSELSGLERVVVTGGGSLYQPCINSLVSELRWAVVSSSTLSAIDESTELLNQGDIDRAQVCLQTAIGLANWRGRAGSSRINLLPQEVLVARQQRRALAATAAAGVGMVVLLAGAWGLQERQVSSVKSATASVNATTATEQAQVNELQPASSYQSAVQARGLTVSKTEAGSIDVPKFVASLGQHLPAGLSVSQLDLTLGASASAAPASPGVASTSGIIGTINMALSGPGTDDTVASFLRKMATYDAVSNVVVGSESASSGTVTFTATADVTEKATRVTRSGS